MKLKFIIPWVVAFFLVVTAVIPHMPTNSQVVAQTLPSPALGPNTWNPVGATLPNRSL